MNMAKQGSERDYKNGQKNNWRRTVWNEVLRRTDGRERDELILYLAGPQDLDRAVATQKGVPDHNLIALDMERRNVTRIRGGKHSAVAGDALDLLWSWPESKHVCAILLDFCSGLESNNSAIYDVLERKPFRRAVVMVNFMRGRDPWSNSIRGLLEIFGLMNPTDVNGLSRAYQFLAYHALDTVQVGFGYGSSSSKAEGHFKAIVPDAGPQRDRLAVLMTRLIGLTDPKYFSYRSGRLTFDSVVFRHAIAGAYSDGLPAMPSYVEAEIQARASRFKEPPLVRRLAAMFATRTMRLESS